MDYSSIVSAFGIPGEFVCATPFGSGHINDTLRIEMKTPEGPVYYILQKLNTYVFPDPDILMSNGFKVVKYLKDIIEKRGGDPTRETLRFYPTTDGKQYYRDSEGSCWRLEDIVPDTKSYDLCTSEAQFESTGYAVNKVSAAVRVKNIGIAPLYHNAYVTVNGVRSEKSLKGLLPGEEATFTVAGLTIGDSETPEPTITGDKLLKDATIPYKANLSANAGVIAGLLDENGTTGIAGARSLTHDKGKAASNFGKSRATDLKGRNVPSKAARGVFFPISKH